MRLKHFSGWRAVMFHVGRKNSLNHTKFPTAGPFYQQQLEDYINSEKVRILVLKIPLL